MLGADVVVVHAPGFIHSQLDDLLCPRGETDLPLDGLLAPADDELHGGPHLGQVDAQIGQDTGCYPFGLAHQSQQNVLGADVVVVEALSFFLG